MTRPLRIELAGGLYHVTSRGDRREDIYFSDEDRPKWLELLGEVCAQFNWRCHAWCQMSNHYHIVVETPEANLAQEIKGARLTLIRYGEKLVHRAVSG